MSTTIHCVRTPAESEGGSATVDIPAYRVWLVKRAEFNSNPQRAEWIFAAVTARLQDIFTQVAQLRARGRGNSAEIDLVWADLSELGARRPNECIVYFVPDFQSGLIHRYTSRMMRRSGPNQQYYIDVEQAYSGGTPPHAGLTLEDREGSAPRMLSEVHVDRMLREFPNASNSGLSVESQQGHCRAAGRGIGGMAFHELMHNVIDLNMGRGFNLHDGHGLAAADGHSADPDEDNLRTFRQHMFSATPGQIVPSGSPPTIQAEATASASPAATPDDALAGLDDL